MVYSHEHEERMLILPRHGISKATTGYNWRTRISSWLPLALYEINHTVWSCGGQDIPLVIGMWQFEQECSTEVFWASPCGVVKSQYLLQIEKSKEFGILVVGGKELGNPKPHWVPIHSLFLPVSLLEWVIHCFWSLLHSIARTTNPASADQAKGSPCFDHAEGRRIMRSYRDPAETTFPSSKATMGATGSMCHRASRG
jgi:hypothetical protein